MLVILRPYLWLRDILTINIVWRLLISDDYDHLPSGLQKIHIETTAHDYTSSSISFLYILSYIYSYIIIFLTKRINEVLSILWL